MALRMVFGLAGGLAAVFGQSLFALPLLALAVWPQFGSRALAVIRTLPRDTQFLWRALNSLASLKKIERRNENVPDVFNRQLQAFPNKALIHFNDQTWTFKQMAEYSNRVANTFKDMGFRKGDVVALFMNNCPEYVGIWLGLSKLGVITALVNHNQRNKALIHSCTASHCSAVIFGSDLAQAVIDVSGEVGGAKLLQLSTESGPVTVPSSVLDLNALLDKAATTEPVCKEGERPGYKDILLYVYTSGTTGLPKAAKITHSRYIAAGRGIPSLMGMSPQDVVYAPLPLYHSAGGMCALGYGLMFGMTVVLRAKFSASAFLSDCIKHKCTVVQYVGEICRYVLATPPKPTDTQHSIRVIIGNGMRVSVWQKFVERFRVAQVVELYGSTEGNVTFFNLDNTLGAVGFLPRFLPLSIFPIGFVRVNQETGDIIRNKDGLCERCEVNEPGMLVGHISDKDPSREFHGYADDSSSEKKILRDVYQKGDKWFLSGDILVMDNLGYIFFRDRTGDTFRWKGENVSTTEVEATVSAAVGNRDIAVYGVEVAGSEGRAGMVAIADPDGTVNLDALAESVDRNLPVYARPLFVRLPPALEKTGTFKIVKVNMQREGYDPSTISDPLFIRNGKKFVPLTPEVHNDLCSGKLRL